MIEVKGDLFHSLDSKCMALAHCVSEDLVMGKGIAVEFKHRFGRLPELCAQKPKVGGVVSLTHQMPTGRKEIYYLITKAKYWGKPTYKTLESSLRTMCAHATTNDISSIAIPKIGCGLDRLSWPRVKAILAQFTEIQFYVYSR